VCVCIQSSKQQPKKKPEREPETTMTLPLHKVVESYLSHGSRKPSNKREFEDAIHIALTFIDHHPLVSSEFVDYVDMRTLPTYLLLRISSRSDKSSVSANNLFGLASWYKQHQPSMDTKTEDAIQVYIAATTIMSHIQFSRPPGRIPHESHDLAIGLAGKDLDDETEDDETEDDETEDEEKKEAEDEEDEEEEEEDKERKHANSRVRLFLDPMYATYADIMKRTPDYTRNYTLSEDVTGDDAPDVRYADGSINGNENVSRILGPDACEEPARCQVPEEEIQLWFDTVSDHCRDNIYKECNPLKVFDVMIYLMDSKWYSEICRVDFRHHEGGASPDPTVRVTAPKPAALAMGLRGISKDLSKAEHMMAIILTTSMWDMLSRALRQHTGKHRMDHWSLLFRRMRQCAGDLTISRYKERTIVQCLIDFHLQIYSITHSVERGRTGSHTRSFTAKGQRGSIRAHRPRGGQVRQSRPRYSHSSNADSNSNWRKKMR
jgi:hypothetical protein